MVLALSGFAAKGVAQEGLRFTTPADPSQAAPEALAVLPAQTYNHAHRMPLLRISVLSWLCDDLPFRQALGIGSKAACYTAIAPAADTCTASLQADIPGSGERGTNGDLKLLDFRQRYHDCIVTTHVEGLIAQGRLTAPALAARPDPLRSELEN
jgi:hypothetical protein